MQKDFTAAAIAETLDHSALKPQMTEADIIKACAMGKKYRTASVCVRPTDAALAKKELAGSQVKLAVVVGFPHGYHQPEVKALESKLAIDEGADELDMVLNIGALLFGNYDLVEKDISAVVKEAKPRGVLVKVILETCYLSKEQIVTACRLSEAVGANYVKSSTGFGTEGATIEVIQLMLNTVGGRLGVKASGGIRSYDKAVTFLQLGCERLGVTATEAIMTEALQREQL